MFKKSYFIRSNTERPDGTTNENWSVFTIPLFASITARVNKYRHDLENEHKGECFIVELRRL